MEGGAESGRLALSGAGGQPNRGVRLPDQARPATEGHQGDPSSRDLGYKIPIMQIPKTKFSAKIFLLVGDRIEE
jgi:hypothetical protein